MMQQAKHQNANPQGECGVLVYRVDLKRPAGRGPIEVLPAAPDSGDKELEKSHITLYHALYHSGTVISDASANLHIEIIGREGKGFQFRVAR